MGSKYEPFLRSLKIFHGFSPEELGIFMGILREQKLRRDEILFREGQKGNACYIIVDGAIRVSVERGGLTEQLAVLPPGALFGQVALIDGGRRSATCAADELSTVLAMDRNEFDLLFSSGSSFAFKFIDLLTRILVGQLRNANTRLAEVAVRESAAQTPRLPTDPELQRFFKELATQTSSIRLDDPSLAEMEVVIPASEIYKQHHRD